MTKIAFVIGGLPFGGVESWLFDIALRIKKTELYECRIFNVSGTGVKMPEFRDAEIDVVCIGSSNASASTHRIDTILKLRKKLKNYSPDIIHTLHFGGDYFGRLAAIGLKIPVVTHIRNIKREKKISRRFFNKFLSLFTDAYISISKAVGDVVERDHNLFKRRHFLLYNGFDANRLECESHDLRAMYGISGAVVIGIGRYVEQKNFESLIRAVKILFDQGQDVSLVLVGEGRCRPKYEELIVELGLQRRVVLTGYKNDVAAFLRGADILAMPSFYEGFPIVHLEAMYCGVPGVISKFVPSLEVFSEASLVNDCSPTSLADGIGFLLNNPQECDKIVKNGKDIVKDYVIERYMDKLFLFYSEIITRM